MSMIFVRLFILFCIVCGSDVLTGDNVHGSYLLDKKDLKEALLDQTNNDNDGEDEDSENDCWTKYGAKNSTQLFIEVIKLLRNLQKDINELKIQNIVNKKELKDIKNDVIGLKAFLQEDYLKLYKDNHVNETKMEIYGTPLKKERKKSFKKKDSPETYKSNDWLPKKRTVSNPSIYCEEDDIKKKTNSTGPKVRKQKSEERKLKVNV